MYRYHISKHWAHIFMKCIMIAKHCLLYATGLNFFLLNLVYYFIIFVFHMPSTFPIMIYFALVIRHHDTGILLSHYSDMIMSAMASWITGVSIIYLTVCSGADQRKYQNFASLAFARGNHRSPANSPHKGPVTRKMFPFVDVIMSLSITAVDDWFNNYHAVTYLAISSWLIIRSLWSCSPKFCPLSIPHIYYMSIIRIYEWIIANWSYPNIW